MRLFIYQAENFVPLCRAAITNLQYVFLYAKLVTVLCIRYHKDRALGARDIRNGENKAGRELFKQCRLV